jgi:zinc and cadmium transporter
MIEAILVLFFIAILGGGVLLLGRKITPSQMKLLLAFSAAYLLALTFLHLLPEVMGGHADGIGFYILLGFLLQIVLDYFSQGIEHGHAHIHEHTGARFYWMVTISLWIHAFIEGMPFGASEDMHVGHAHHHNHDHEHSLLIGIAFHKFTESFVFASLLLHLLKSKAKAWGALVMFAMVAPIGALIFHYTNGLAFLQMEHALSVVMALLIGIILHVATTILFESEEGHRFNRMKFLVIILGMLCAAIL